MGSRKILVSLTTLIGDEWKKKIEEIDALKIKEISLFLTGLAEKKRKELYALLEKTGLQEIPHVHARTDMSPAELEYLAKKYKTRAFNIHPLAEYPLSFDYSKYALLIYVENAALIPTDDDLEKFGGLCLDLAHWENEKLSGNAAYDQELSGKAEKYKIGCVHISAIREKPVPTVVTAKEIKYDSHFLKELQNLDYVKKYLAYLPDILSIELENPLKEQLEAKKYLEEILKAQK